jgi:hypothetical protein
MKMAKLLVDWFPAAGPRCRQVAQDLHTVAKQLQAFADAGIELEHMSISRVTEVQEAEGMKEFTALAASAAGASQG